MFWLGYVTSLRKLIHVCVCMHFSLLTFSSLNGREMKEETLWFITSTSCRAASLILACCFKNEPQVFSCFWYGELKSISSCLDSQHIGNHRLERPRRVGRAVGSWQWAPAADWKSLHFLHWVMWRFHCIPGHTLILLGSLISRILSPFPHNFWRPQWSQGHSTDRQQSIVFGFSLSWLEVMLWLQQ